MQCLLIRTLTFSRKIVFNRFHVMKHVNGAVDSTRKRENRMFLEKGLAHLKGTRYIWLYSPGNLPEKYREKYEEVKKSDLLTGKAYSMTENIRDLSTAPSMDDTMKAHLEKIMNYFVHKITNARGEGINSKKALIEKMAYGFRNKEHLKTAIYFSCGNLQLYP